MGITVTRAAQNNNLLILEFSDGTKRLAELGEGRDEPLTVPEPNWDEVEIDDDGFDPWTLAEMDGSPVPIEPFTENDQNFWNKHWPIQD